MKKLFELTLACLVALTSAGAAAELITVELTGTVDIVNDGGNALGGQVQVGQTVTGSYTYDTSVPDQDPNPEFGRYEQNPAVMAVQLNVGGLAFATNEQPASTAGAFVDVMNTSWADGMHIASIDNNRPLPSGASVMHIDVDLYDPSGTAHGSDSLPVTAPDLGKFENKDIYVAGQSTTGVWYDFRVKILTATLVSGPAAPEGTFELTADVTYVYDPANVLNYTVTPGNTISGSYRIDTDVPDSAPGDPQWGSYEQPALPGYGFSLQVGEMTVESDPLDVYRPVRVEVVDSGSDEFHLLSAGSTAQGPSGTLQVDYIDMWLMATNNAVWISDALNPDAPPLEKFDYRDLVIGGYDAYGNHWQIVAKVRSITAANPEPPAQPVVVTPASGFFVRPQLVEAAFLMPVGRQFAGLSGTVNGMPVDGWYVSSCMLKPLWASGRDALRCPDIQPLLAAGVNTVSWTVQFGDGTSVTESVKWEVFE